MLDFMEIHREEFEEFDNFWKRVQNESVCRNVISVNEIRDGYYDIQGFRLYYQVPDNLEKFGEFVKTKL